MIIRARAPLRLGLGGGGTDVSPFCDLHGGLVLNATIDKYAYATLTPRTDRKVGFSALDQKSEALFDLDTAISVPFNDQLDLHKGVYQRMMREFNRGEPLSFTLSTYLDMPVGSGLGSSSTLVVTMVKAFVELLNIPLSEYEIAHLAYEIEREDVGLNGGKQDQYAAAFGGFNFIEFYAGNRVMVNPLRVKNWILCELEASLVLFYTGRSRESAHIIDTQTANIRNNNEKTMSALQTLKEEAVLIKESVLNGNFKLFNQALGMTWQSKKNLSDHISNAHIDDVYAVAMEAGATAGKISGAGGGGFMLFYTPPEKRALVVEALKNLHEGIVHNCHFTKHGCQAWRV